MGGLQLGARTEAYWQPASHTLERLNSGRVHRVVVAIVAVSEGYLRRIVVYGAC